MARMRYVKPEFWTDSRMVGMSLAARLLYIGTWNFAMCDQGHLEDDILRLKMQVFPADSVNVKAALKELMDAGRIVRLVGADGATYLQVVHLKDHQKVDPRWTPRCPACKNAESLSETQESLGELSGTLPNSPQEGIGGEGIGDKNTSRRSRDAETDPALFDAFWAVYPKRSDKGHARTAYAKALKKTDAETLTLGAKRYAATVVGTEPKFIALPATWLNGERWDDDPAPQQVASPARSAWDKPFVGEAR